MGFNVTDAASKSQADSSLKKSGSSVGTIPGNTEPGTEEVNGGCTSSCKAWKVENKLGRAFSCCTFSATAAPYDEPMNDLHSAQNESEKQNLAKGPKTFVDRRIEAIPALLQDAIDRLVDSQVMTAKPDSCVIDVYNEPICVMFLTECDITFGRMISVDHPGDFGDFRGSLKLSLAPGSLLVMHGKSADFAKHALPSVRKQRILITFTKYQPKKSMSDNPRLPSPSLSQSSQWVSSPSRSPNHFRLSAGPKHYAAIPTTGVMPAPPIRPQIPPSNGVQPLFVSTPVPPAIAFPASVPIPPGSTGWPAAAPRHPPPRLPIPGTGVFLPPSGSNSASQQSSTTATEPNIPVETSSPLENEIESGKTNQHAASPEVGLDKKSPKQDCNGSVDGSESGRAIVKEEAQCAENSVKQSC
ncbi:hypothetical protein GOBAR_AA23337 [Gossypium barbadense]|uniref:Alpha-ketoglutarate-dependent dioxygenase AlkB-like domain-containing protein n=1 Tax=Gossypium barbadense TaxID=3634 RepID=A0A2P5X1X6_GOSBA|nr:hypothetical protein GOBAR_AA23337 [Gossypium barbadense]